MRILHTADWHIGRSLKGESRYEEFDAFFQWLDRTIREQHIEALIVPGDIFDTQAPTSRAQKIYYSFLAGLIGSPCRHVVVTSGNHDSATLLDAPGALLKHLQVRVVGTASVDLSEEVLELRNPAGAVELIVCAVPYLRDGDLRRSTAGEGFEQLAQKAGSALKAHYEGVAKIAAQKRQALAARVPVVAMGHLFTAGGMTGEGVRDIHYAVGGEDRVDAGIFSEEFDYVALGHLHVPQEIKARPLVRYSGSPIPMGFGEAEQKKSVCVVEFSGRQPTVSLLEVPVFRKLERIHSSVFSEIARQLKGLKESKSTALVEVVYKGEETIPNLQQQLNAISKESDFKLLAMHLEPPKKPTETESEKAPPSLEELNPEQVFELCLETNRIAKEKRPILLRCFREVVQAVQEADPNAE